MSMRKQQRFAFAMRWLFLESRPLSSSVFYAVAVLQVTIMPKLILLQEGQTIPFELTVDETVIGRHPECTFQINSNMVSRKHAKVVKTADGYAIEDMGSGNGTFVNSKKIEGQTSLANEDRIKLGPMLLRFEGAVAAPKPASAPGPAAAAGRPSTPAADMNVDLSEGEEDTATIMGMAERSTGFGKLEVNSTAKLKGVLDISRALAGTSDLDALLPKILDTLFNIFPHADRGCILFKDEATGKMIPKSMKHRRAGDDETVKLSRTILKSVMEEKTGILSADAASDSRFNASESIANLTIRSMMCVPLLSLAGEPMGIINIDTQNAFNQFGPEDLDLLMAIAGQAAMSYEQAKLLVTAMEKQKQDKEMNIAMGVQRSLLPTDLPKPDGWEIFASYDTAQAVGGDYYDVFTLDDNHVVLLVGDASGHGMKAAMSIMVMHTLVRMIRTQRYQNTAAFVTEINNQLCQHSIVQEEGGFITLAYGLLTLSTNELQWTSAGHPIPLVQDLDTGEIKPLAPDNVAGLPLAIYPDVDYDTIHSQLPSNYRLLFYTDGLQEAFPDHKPVKTGEFGVAGIMQTLASKRGVPAVESLQALFDDSEAYTEGSGRHDDTSAVMLERHR